ncbi:hypothetical protein FB451DRAFT_1535027 [Mycena latifolia]|nr:hypothetical protein FB451DRAFT_1535027 [Mycena latifolia]
MRLDAVRMLSWTRKRARDAPATFPRLPEDLERMIFELVAWEDPKTVPALVRVAKRTLFWLEPLLYRVLVLRDDPTAIARIHDLLAQKSDSLWRNGPRHLFLGLAIASPATTDALLRKCTAIYDLLLYCGPAPSQNFLPQLAALPLRRLAIDMHHLFSNLPALDVRPPAFAHLTHLLLIDILYSAPAAAEPWAAQLARLPRLTHLAFLATAEHTVQPRALLRAVLTQCAGLRVLVALHAEHRKMSAQKLHRKLRVADERFVVVPFVTLAEDWEMGARGGADFWARADAFIDAKARGEIDDFAPPSGGETKSWPWQSPTTASHSELNTQLNEMFSKLIPLALCALSVVRAAPAMVSCQVTIEAIGQSAFSTKVPELAPFKIINLAVHGSAFALEGSDNVFTQIGDIEHGPNGLWVGFKTGEDKYLVQNVGTGGYIKPQGRLIIGPRSEATEFAVERAGNNVWELKLPNEDRVWEAVYDGSSMIFGYVSLRPASGEQSQHWTFARD